MVVHIEFTIIIHIIGWGMQTDVCMLMCVPEIPGFLSVEESSVVMQLAQLKGLTHSSLLTVPDSQEEQLTQDELFSLLDLNQDGLLQREEVRHSHSKLTASVEP